MTQFDSISANKGTMESHRHQDVNSLSERLYIHETLTRDITFLNTHFQAIVLSGPVKEQKFTTATAIRWG